MEQGLVTFRHWVYLQERLKFEKLRAIHSITYLGSEERKRLLEKLRSLQTSYYETQLLIREGISKSLAKKTLEHNVQLALGSAYVDGESFVLALRDSQIAVNLLVEGITPTTPNVDLLVESFALSFFEDLINPHNSEHDLLRVIHELAKSEFSRRTHLTTMFQENSSSMLSRMLWFYTKRKSQVKYLKLLFKKPLMKISTEYTEDWVLDLKELPQAETEQEEISPKVQETLTRVSEQVCFYSNCFLESIYSNLNAMPKGLRWVCKVLSDLSKATVNLPEEGRNVMLGTLLFMIWWLPAIISSEENGLTQSVQAGSLRKNISLVANVLKRVFRSEKFELPQYKIINEFISLQMCLACRPKMKEYFNELVKIDDPLNSSQIDFQNCSERLKTGTFDPEGVMSYYYSESLESKRPRVVPLVQTTDDMAKVQELSVQAVMLSLPELKLLVDLVVARKDHFLSHGLESIVTYAENLRKHTDSPLFSRSQKEIRYIILMREHLHEDIGVGDSHRSYSALPKSEEFKQRKVLSRVKEAVRSLFFGLDSFSLFFESTEDSSLDQIVEFVLRFSYIFESRKSSQSETVPVRVLAQYLQTHLCQITEDYRAYNYRKLYCELVSEHQRRASSQTAQLLLICKPHVAISSVEKHLASIKQELKVMQSSQRNRRFLTFVKQPEVPSCLFHEDSGHVFVSSQKDCPHSKYETNLSLNVHPHRRSSFLPSFHNRGAAKSSAEVHIPGHTQTIEEFVHDFTSLDSVRFSLLQEKDLANVGEAFIAYMHLVSEAISVSDFYRGKSEEELDEVLEQVEAFITRHIYTVVFPREPTEADVRFSAMTRKLAWVEPAHLSIPQGQFMEDMLVSAAKVLKDMDDCLSPAEKLGCLIECVTVIVNILELSGNSEVGTGDTTPIIIYVLLKAQPARMHSNLNYIQRFRNREKMLAEGGFCFTAVQSAIEFIERITWRNLNVSEEEFLLRMNSD